MKAESFIQVGLLTLLVLFGSKLLGQLLFLVMEKIVFRKYRDQQRQSLDDLLLSQRIQLYIKKIPQVEKEDQKVPGTLLQLDPEEMKKKEILKRIYEVDLKQKPNEPNDHYYARILDFPIGAHSKEIKKAFNKKAKALHPDCFDLSAFDKKLQEKLKRKIHQNYLIIQKAYDHFKSAA